MEFIIAKCPNCGAELQLDRSTQTASCTYCRSDIIIKDSVPNSLMPPIGNIENLLLRASQFFDSCDYDKAIEYYDKVLDLDANNQFAKNGIELSRQKKKYDNSIITSDATYSLSDFVIAMNLLSEGDKINAIKKVRDVTNWSLRDSKAFIDKVALSNLKTVQKEINDGIWNITNNSAKKTGCYIATAVYGSYDAPEVLVLRHFRDNVLAHSCSGRAFVRAYYRLSPPIANWLSDTKRINAIVRVLLNKLVKTLNK